MKHVGKYLVAAVICQPLGILDDLLLSAASVEEPQEALLAALGRSCSDMHHLIAKGMVPVFHTCQTVPVAASVGYSGQYQSDVNHDKNVWLQVMHIKNRCAVTALV